MGQSLVPALAINDGRDTVDVTTKHIRSVTLPRPGASFQ